MYLVVFNDGRNSNVGYDKTITECQTLEEAIELGKKLAREAELEDGLAEDEIEALFDEEESEALNNGDMNAEWSFNDSDAEWYINVYKADGKQGASESTSGISKERLLEILDNILAWGNDHEEEFRECLLNAMDLTDDEIKELQLEDYVDDSGEDDDEEYNDEHAKEWMEKHPHGWYNNENDYGTGDEEVDEEEFWVIVYSEKNSGEEKNEQYPDFDDARADFKYMTEQIPEDYDYVVFQHVIENEVDGETIEEIDRWDNDSKLSYKGQLAKHAQKDPLDDDEDDESDDELNDERDELPWDYGKHFE